jgi:hypothetical protein
MRKLGSQKGFHILQVTEDEWGTLMKAGGIPYDKRNDCTDCTTTGIAIAQDALAQMQTFRIELGKLQSKWDKLAIAIDNILPK